MPHMYKRSGDGRVERPTHACMPACRSDPARVMGLANFQSTLHSPRTTLCVEPEFPLTMPHYYCHASHFAVHTHVRALMRPRCFPDPFVACRTLHC